MTNKSSSYMTMKAGGPGGVTAVQRIRNPTENDVLLGRGGGINGHVGNRVFREWVRERKQDYNLAPTKAEKTRVALEVMALVTNRNGRFLQRDPSSAHHNTSSINGWWIEVDQARALAKTSQALREGAPQIRAAGGGGKKNPKRKRGISRTTMEPPPPYKKSKPTAWPQTVPTLTPVISPASSNKEGKERALQELGRNFQQASQTPIRPLMSNQEFQQQEQSKGGAVDFEATTPPLTSQENDLPSLPSFQLVDPALVPPSLPPRTSISRSSSAGSGNGLSRNHSLALSDISAWAKADGSDVLGEDFVNPFLDESDLSQLTPSTPSISKTTADPLTITSPPVRGMVRNVSSDEGKEDYGTLGEPLFDFPTTPKAPTLATIPDFHQDLRDAVEDADEDGSTHKMPTLLMPWRGGALQRRYGSSSSMNSGTSNHNHNHQRQ